MDDSKRLKRKVRNSYFISTVSITLVLFLLGSVGYLMLAAMKVAQTLQSSCLLYTSPSPRDAHESRLPACA